MAASLPSGGGGTLVSHAMLTKTLRPDGMLIVVGEAAALLAGRGGSGEGGVHETEFCAMDLMQKPGVGTRETVVVADIMERERAERGGVGDG